MKLFGKNEDISNIITEIENMTGCKVVQHKEKRKDFDNSSLGIEEPGENYMQVITPGYIINVKLKCGSDEYKKVYHSNLEGSILKEKH